MEERADVGAGLAGAALGGGLAGRPGREISFAGCRVALFGNRTGNKYRELPHYHRKVPHPKKAGESADGQGIKRHRPWQPKATDKSFWDRF